MTVVVCPHGCGGMINTATDNFCPSCRRNMSETEIILSEDVVKVEGVWGWNYPDASPVQRKLSWCWKWWGPADHRMRCRLLKGHEGDHDTHEERRSDTVIVATNGQVVSQEAV
jgi:hypothetical protein